MSDQTEVKYGTVDAGSTKDFFQVTHLFADLSDSLSALVTDGTVGSKGIYTTRYLAGEIA